MVINSSSPWTFLSFSFVLCDYNFGSKCSVKVLHLWSTFSLSKIEANHTCFAIMWIVLEHRSNYICTLRLISSLVEPCWSHNIIRSVSFRQSHHSSWRAASFGKNYFSNSYLFNYLFIFIYSFFLMFLSESFALLFLILWKVIAKI